MTQRQGRQLRVPPHEERAHTDEQRTGATFDKRGESGLQLTIGGDFENNKLLSDRGRGAGRSEAQEIDGWAARISVRSLRGVIGSASTLTPSGRSAS